MIWYYAKGRPKDELQAAQNIVITWERPDWYSEDPKSRPLLLDQLRA